MLVDRARRLVMTAADSGAARDIVRQAAQDFIDAFQGADARDVNAALEILGGAFALPYTEHLASVLATVGFLVERGADVTPLVVPTVEFLQRVTPLAVDFHDACAKQIPDDLDDADAAFRQAASRLRSDMPRAAEAWGALEALYLPVVAILAASPAARAQSRSIGRQMQHLGECNEGAWWLFQMSMVLDREHILVVEPDTRLGFIGIMSGVSSNFQLHLLLMDVFPQSDPQSGRRISQKAADIVRGKLAQQQDDGFVGGRWNLHAWTALQTTRRLSHDLSQSSTNDWIWNEGVPADIPVFDSYRVVVLGPPSYTRKFAAQRDFLTLRADIEVERLLSAGEVDAWVKRFSQRGAEEMQG
jgi:hypothetical protein